MIRTQSEILAENKLRVKLGLPKTTLTPEERIVFFGEPGWGRNPDEHDAYLAERLRQGLPLSISDKKRARAWLKTQS